MIRNFVLIALRNIDKYRGYSAINILGLSLGMVCSILLLLYIVDELSYDKYHKNGAYVYRVAAKGEINSNPFMTASTPVPLGPSLFKHFEEVKNFTRIVETGRLMVTNEYDEFYEDSFFFVDEQIFKIFDIPLIKGTPEKALLEEGSIVISKELAQKYFGSSDPIGETILTGGDRIPRKITAVMENVRSNSHFRPKALIPYKDLPEERVTNWGSFNDYTYILFRKDYDVADFDDHLKEIYEYYMSDIFYQFNGEASFFLQPLADIHLGSDLQNELEAGGQMEYIYIFSLIAAFILIVACINYMNLATARATKRALEVGLRKVMGSYRNQLVSQFMAESVVFTVIAMLISLLSIKFLLPGFNALTGKQIHLQLLSDPAIILILLVLTIGMGLLAGSYPSIYLSRFQPVEVLKGKFSSGAGAISPMKMLVVIQFAISSIMLICTWIIHDQLNYLSDKELGFTKENLIRVPLDGDETKQKVDVLKYELSTNKHIKMVSSGEASPGSGNYRQNVVLIESDDGSMGEHIIQVMEVDPDYFESLGVRLMQGRNFSEEYGTDLREAVIVNESLVQKMGWENPIGKHIEAVLDPQEEMRILKIVGVVNDFHVLSLHRPMAPMIFVYGTLNDNMFVKISGEKVAETLEYVQKVWLEVVPTKTMNYTFVEDDFKKQYLEDERKGKIFAIFSGLAMFLACLGLLGLVSFTTAQRKKEIGIRKVNGANVGAVIVLIIRDFLILIGISILLAWPFAYYFMINWLRNFAYKVSIDPMSFIYSGVLVLLITLFMISFHAIKAARSSPVGVLKVE
ncbi:ABC transporter permease [Fulvivirgaceae bacterium BMA10]|uniref:ABC transporter permease n=1 Tax=Splendidivirga corallicola TaxID=3051826 RepID=A0ABT8KM00_9BACT|nr:ABC transporter permease [Fulvivirgaceae bacterium BMA10]